MSEPETQDRNSGSLLGYQRFRDLAKLPRHRFRYDNQVRAMRLATPVYKDIASDTITVERPWEVLGWCDRLDGHLMHGREGQIALMMWHPEEGEAWEHYPLFDEDDRDAAKFVSR